MTNALRLLTLPAPIPRRVAAGVLSAGHAKAILSLDRAEDQERVAERIVNEGLSVRATEELVRIAPASRSPARPRRPSGGPEGLRDLEERLSDALMARVQVRVGSRRGRLTIEFGSVEDLERIVGVIADGLSADIPVREQPL